MENKTKVNITHETQVFLPENFEDDRINSSSSKTRNAPKTKTGAKPSSQKPYQGLPSGEGAPQPKQSRFKSVRVLLLALVLLILLGCVVAAILMIIFYPKCPHKPNLEWWQKETAYQIEVSIFKDSDNDGIGDINGLISQLDYLAELGVKTLVLYRVISKDTPRQFDLEYASQEVLDKFKQKLKEKEMHLVLDLPASFLENNDQETIEFWLSNYADGLRIINLNTLNKDESVQSALVSKWYKLAEKISKKSSSPKVITVYPNDKKSVRYVRSFLNASDLLSDTGRFSSEVEKMYHSLEKTEWPVLVFGEYGTPRISNSFGENSNHLRLAHGLLMLLRGTPLTLYGDEIELSGTSEYENVMQWSDEPGCGFTLSADVSSFFREATKNCAHNAADAAKNVNSLIALYKKVASLRNEPSIQWGDVIFSSNKLENIVSFVRRAKDNDAYVVVANTGDQSVVVNLKENHSLVDKATVSLAYSAQDDQLEHAENEEINTDSVQLKSGQLLVLKLNKN